MTKTGKIKTLPIVPAGRRIGSILREVAALLRESFKPSAGRFLPFEVYPSSFRPPMKKSVR